MDACRECRFELPAKVRFCPRCGTEWPLGGTPEPALAVSTAGPTAAPAPGRRSPVPPSAPDAAVASAEAPSAPRAPPPSPDHHPTAAPPPSAATPQSTTAVPQSTTAPQPTTAAPSPTAAPQHTTTAPQRTAAAVPTGAAGAADPAALPERPRRLFSRWLPAAAIVLAVMVMVWVARPLFTPSDPCQSADVSSALNQARAGLAARDHRSALSKSTSALATCVQGQRADELRRIQSEAMNAVVANGRRCLRTMDVACLERVTGDLTPVRADPAAQAFTGDFEREAALRGNRDIAEARRCIAAGDIACAEQRLALPLALRRNDTAVAGLQAMLGNARTAVAAAKSCLASSATECAAEPLEALRRTSPQSPLIKGLERRVLLSTLALEPPSNPGAPALPTPQAETPRPAPRTVPMPGPAAVPSPVSPPMPSPVPTPAPAPVQKPMPPPAPVAPVAPDPSVALVQRLIGEGERCRLQRDCGCMKDKAVAVINIDPQNPWADAMRAAASQCARAKVTIE